jgi:uncharacterized protein (DUF302 family)
MDNGIRTLTTPQPVDEVVERLTSFLSARDVKLFAIIDHSAEADAVGLLMPNTKLLIFGNPKAGTPVMIAAPSAALDLPLKILVSQQPDGSSSISWNDPAWLQQRHNIWPEFLPNISVVESLVHKALD